MSFQQEIDEVASQLFKRCCHIYNKPATYFTSKISILALTKYVDKLVTEPTSHLSSQAFNSPFRAAPARGCGGHFSPAISGLHKYLKL